MAKATKKESALDMFGNIPAVKTQKKEIEKEKTKSTGMPTNIVEKVQKGIEKTYPKKSKISAYADAELIEQFKKTCKERGLKFSDVLEQLISLYVNN